jgi:hypothetical protein
MKGTPVNPKTAKQLLRVGLAVTAMLAYGGIHKVEKMLGDKIDERYEEPKSETEQED